MKKLLLTATLALSFTANAAFVGEGSPVYTVISIKEAVELKDDTKVLVEGFIVKQLGDDLYLFKDASGEVEMEIDDSDFREITVTSKDKLRITAEVDSNLTGTSLEVDYLELVK
ncbi:NirD/YgiW/YdeI family stress tolerance protein [Colwellia echini]|uniref:NirD/YgiW/YdeI family stress tolerance protein n=1 Tax=Colwellia echini TaxID=1982103 RepID=A0ABY3MVR4_9GAMM|nr:NirD/YgiW/YdeI family stress tolerance protein [Colwellia echini]TYK65231.1 NirD/YgiW/YdeI family stress tolerance protein [Colwellia echini]